MANVDETKGRIERAAGELTDDEDKKRRGSVDKAAGKAKESIDKGADRLKDKLD